MEEEGEVEQGNPKMEQSIEEANYWPSAYNLFQVDVMICKCKSVIICL